MLRQGISSRVVPTASQKQIAANRANAKRSTGPKTAAGPSTSSRHGLSRPLQLDPASSTRLIVAGQIRDRYLASIRRGLL
jgi:hypothetical protein